MLIAPLHTISGRSAAWHCSTHTEWWMLRVNDLARFCIMNLISTTGGLLRTQKEGRQLSLRTI